MVRAKKMPAKGRGVDSASARAAIVSETATATDSAIALCIPSTDVARFKPLVDACSLSVVSLESVWNGVAIGFNPGRQNSQELPARLLGLLAYSSDGANDVKNFLRVWERQFEQAAPPSLIVETPFDSSDVLGWIARQLVSAQHVMAQRNTTLMRDMYAIRADHEAMQEAFQRLENYAYASSMLVRQLALCLEPQKTTVKLGKGLAGSVQQLLPTSSAGVCDVGVHVAQTPKDSQGWLEVALHTLEDGRTAAKWTVAASKIRQGWLQMGLEKALSADPMSIALHVQWFGSGEINLSLAGPHPEERWCAKVGSKPAQAPLGMKVWRSLPGTRSAPAANANMNEGADQQALMLYADAMRKVENLGSLPDGIAFVEHWNSLLVHPLGGTTTWARLSGAVPEGVTRISADIETRNEKAGPVEYAIALAPASDRQRKTQNLQFKPGLISDWIRVGTKEQSQVHLNLTTAVTKEFDLYLGTRLTQGASNAFCWAHFSKIKMFR